MLAATSERRAPCLSVARARICCRWRLTRARAQIKRVKSELDTCHHALRHRAAELDAAMRNLAPSAAARMRHATREMHGVLAGVMHYVNGLHSYLMNRVRGAQQAAAAVCVCARLFLSSRTDSTYLCVCVCGWVCGWNSACVISPLDTCQHYSGDVTARVRVCVTCTGGVHNRVGRAGAAPRGSA